MKRAILHIGTEKTGTTSIQKFLFENRFKLSENGFLFPQSAGYISNLNLVVYGKDKPEADLVISSIDATDPAELSHWKEQFVHEHCSEVIAFQKRNRDSTIVYSAEHLQSRLIEPAEIRRVARLLRPMFDEIRILVYLRRQDRYAHSAHSTWVRAGGDRTFGFESLNGEGPYYDYENLLRNWSDVFGEQSIDVRLFEKPRLHNQNVVDDFAQVTGISGIDAEFRTPDSVNEALSYTALSLVRRFNTLPENDPRLLGHAKEKLREFLLYEVQSITDSFGRFLPARRSAENFYSRFRESNQWIAETWLSGRGFDESFDDYPEQEPEKPKIENLDDLLDEQIAKCLTRRKEVQARNRNTGAIHSSSESVDLASKRRSSSPIYRAAPRYARRIQSALRKRLLKAI